MKYHIVVNGYSKDYLQQIKELYGFANVHLPHLKEGTSFLICSDRVKAEEITSSFSGEVQVLYAQEYSPEAITTALSKRMDTQDVYLFGSDFTGAELSVRTAARTGGSSVVSVHGCKEAANGIYIKKMTYSNHMEATLLMKNKPFCIAVAKGMESAELVERTACVTEWIELESPDFIVSSRQEMEEITEELKDSNIIIVAGRGTKSKDNVEKIEQAAQCLDAKVGVSRPAAMNAWAPMNKLIGVSGKMLSPDICITAGVSGAAAFYAGIEKSKFIVAINTDENAPIMKKADVSVVDDFASIIEELCKLVESKGQE